MASPQPGAVTVKIPDIVRGHHIARGHCVCGEMVEGAYIVHVIRYSLVSELGEVSLQSLHVLARFNGQKVNMYAWLTTLYNRVINS